MTRAITEQPVIVLPLYIVESRVYYTDPSPTLVPAVSVAYFLLILSKTHQCFLYVYVKNRLNVSKICFKIEARTIQTMAA